MTDQQLESLLHELRQTGEAHAQAEAERTYLEEFKKAKLALLMKEAETNGFKTAAAQEREALSHPEYKQQLEGLKVATHKALKNKHKLDALKLRLSVWQTQAANARIEQSAYNRIR